MASYVYNCNDNRENQNTMRATSYHDMYEQEESHFWFVGKQAFIRSVLSGIKIQSANILDIGCGTGGTTKTLTRYGTVTGIEANPLAATYARSRGQRVLTQSANHLPFKKGSFDLVTILDVLYHKGIQEPDVLAEAFRVLKPNGIVLITDCAMPWAWSHHDVIMEAKYRYTKGQLRNFVTGAGFHIDTIQYIYATTFPLFMLSRLVMKNKNDAARLPRLPQKINNLFTSLLSYEASLFPRLNPPFGSSILVLARKPRSDRGKS